MILEKFEGIKKIIIDNNEFPINDYISMYDIFRKSVVKYYDDSSIKERYKLEYNIIYLGEKKEAQVKHTMYLVVLRDKTTNEYLVSTIDYIEGRFEEPYRDKNYDFYTFNILDTNNKTMK